ncbi:MAG: formylglycine-generating enzyme family protein [Planctomycetaceae bacterium]|nr:formylglycine-generating enzyme family protein [Planctomycetaceae bacterium]
MMPSARVSTVASRWTGIAVLIAACCAASPASTHAADDAELPRLLQTFVEELVEITPGAGQFPAELARAPLNAGDAPRIAVLTDAFAIARYEIPQNLYAAVMGANPSRWTGPRNSAEMMSWAEACEFCRKLTSLLRDAQLIAKTDEIRLPTEIEWEYCCRAGTTTAYSFGDAAQAPGDAGNKASLLDPYGWHTGNAAGNDPPVGALRPNPWGLYDVHGYLWEFCSDAWSESIAAEPSQQGESTPPEQVVIRGGSWKDAHDQLTSASRRGFAANGRDDAVGLRCIRARMPGDSN